MDKKLLKEEYKRLLTKAIEGRPGGMALMIVLEETDFYNSPASAKHHLNVPGGLLLHSLNVARAALELCENMPQFAGCDKNAVLTAALLHDVCKAGNYIQKPDGSYQYRDTDLLGHGEASVINIQHWIHLTEKEVLAIRWHMGAYTGERDWDTLTASGPLGGHRRLKNFRLQLRKNTSRKGKNMKIDVGKIALVAVMIAGIQVNVLYHRIDDLECQRDIYKSRYEDWEGVSKEIAEYADTLRDSLKARDRLDGKLLVEDAGDFLCTAYCTEKREHICGTGTGITASGAPVEADVTVAADPDVFPFGTILYIEDIGVRIVQDKGAGIQGKHLDVAVSGSHEDALNWNGYGTHRVWIIKEGE